MKNKLTQILEKDEEGKPKIKLTPFLEETVVNPRTQESYDELMRVFECGDLKYVGEGLPSKNNYWKIHGKETCVEAKERFGYAYTNFFKCNGPNHIISPKQFYKKQNITSDMRKEINEYFENNKSDFKSGEEPDFLRDYINKIYEK